MIVGGLKTDPDDRIRTTFAHNPSSLRLCSFGPNLQQIPRGGHGEDNWVKDIFIAAPGHTLYERDFSGIEAVLVGYFAGSSSYIRLAKRDVHTFYTAYAINALDPGRVSSNDLPLLSDSDDTLFTRLADLKKVLKADRNDLYKHLVHGANYLQSPGGAADHIFKTTGKVFDRKLVTKVMGIYFELFPEIRRWHRELCERVDGARGTSDDPACVIRNPFGYVHRFYHVLDWEKIDNEWVSSFGEDAKRLISFLPQSTAAAIIKQAAKALFYRYPWVGETLRLLIHDSTLGEAADDRLYECLATSRAVMEAPIPELPLDPTWNMGEFLSINTEAKIGKCWGDMQEVA